MQFLWIFYFIIKTYSDFIYFVVAHVIFLDASYVSTCGAESIDE